MKKFLLFIALMIFGAFALSAVVPPPPPVPPHPPAPPHINHHVYIVPHMHDHPHGHPTAFYGHGRDRFYRSRLHWRYPLHHANIVFYSTCPGPNWILVDEGWVLPPFPGAVWISGYWNFETNEWIFGHWEE